jgi:hypothetical protein
VCKPLRIMTKVKSGALNAYLKLTGASQQEIKGSVK